MRLLQGFSDALNNYALPKALGAQTKGDILEDRHMGKEHVVLKDIADGAFLGRNAHVLVTIKVHHAIERNLPLIRVQQPREQSQHGRFASAALTEQHSRFASFRRKMH